jgi:hypothetical protein
MKNIEIEIVDKKVLEKERIIPRYITFVCKNCGNVWGVNTMWSVNHTLTKNDLICRKCAYEKAYGTIEE